MYRPYILFGLLDQDLAAWRLLQHCNYSIYLKLIMPAIVVIPRYINLNPRMFPNIHSLLPYNSCPFATTPFPPIPFLLPQGPNPPLVQIQSPLLQRLGRERSILRIRINLVSREDMDGARSDRRGRVFCAASWGVRERNTIRIQPQLWHEIGKHEGVDEDESERVVVLAREIRKSGSDRVPRLAGVTAEGEEVDYRLVALCTWR